MKIEDTCPRRYQALAKALKEMTPDQVIDK